MPDLALATEKDKIYELENRIKQLEDIIFNLTCGCGIKGLYVYKKVDKYSVMVPLREYIHYNCNGFKEDKKNG